MPPERYAEFYRMARVFYARKGIRDDADDLTQEAMIRVMLAARRTEINNAYAYRVFSSVLTDWFRSQRATLVSTEYADGNARTDLFALDTYAVERHIGAWSVLVNELSRETDRISLYCIAHDIPAAEQAERWPDLYATVRVVYESRRNALNRARSALRHTGVRHAA